MDKIQWQRQREIVAGKIQQWLDKVFELQSWISHETGLNPAYLSRVMNSHQNLGLDYVEKIHKLSEGSLGLKELRPDLYEKFKTYGCLKDIL